MQPGEQFGGYRIEAVEREGVLIARHPAQDRPVALHVARDPPGALSSVRFLERAHRLGAVEHPHLLGVYDARTVEDRAVAVAQAPPGRRLDQLLQEGPIGPAQGTRIARQVASAVDALEEAGAEPPPLIAERVWIDGAGDAHLDGLDGQTGVEIPPAASAAAAIAHLLDAMTAPVPAALQAVLTRAADGAYLSAGQLAAELRRLERAAARRRRRIAIAVAVVATVVLVAVLALADVLNG